MLPISLTTLPKKVAISRFVIFTEVPLLSFVEELPLLSCVFFGQSGARMAVVAAISCPQPNNLSCNVYRHEMVLLLFGSYIVSRAFFFKHTLYAPIHL